MPEKSSLFWLAFTSPGVLFPLMALFLWFDIYRYKAFIPLFIAGKCIGIFSLLGWAVFFKNLTIVKGFFGVIPELVFLSGDLFALAAILCIYKSIRITNKPATAQEDKQCE